MRTLRPMRPHGPLRSVPLLLVVAAALLAPAQAFAGGGTTTPVARYWVITGLVLGGQAYDASGKLALEGDQLMASVGCNSIGGQVGVDGDVVTIGDSLVMTEMACPGVLNEDVFVKILQRGPFRITSGAWVGDGAQILVDELDVPVPGRTLPPDQGVPPDQTVTSSPEPVDPGMSCPPVPIDPGFGGGSGGSTGSGGGSTGSGGTIGSGTGTGSGSGENPAATAVAGPVEVPPATPAVEPGGVPGEGGSGDPGMVPPAPPAPDQTPGLDEGPTPSLVVGPVGSAVAVPDPGVGTDPGVGKPPVDDPCAPAYANDTTAGSGTGGVPPQSDSLAAAEHDKATSEAAAFVVPGVIGLAFVAALGVLAVRRWRATRPGTGVDASR